MEGPQRESWHRPLQGGVMTSLWGPAKTLAIRWLGRAIAAVHHAALGAWGGEEGGQQGRRELGCGGGRSPAAEGPRRSGEQAWMSGHSSDSLEPSVTRDGEVPKGNLYVP